MEKVKVQEILKRHLGDVFNVEYSKKLGTEDYQWLQAIKEIVETVVDKCAEEASLTDSSYESLQEGSSCAINKDSIFQVKQMFDYE